MPDELPDPGYEPIETQQPRELSSRQLDLPFSGKEWRFFAAVVVANLALDVVLMVAEQW